MDKLLLLNILLPFIRKYTGPKEILPIDDLLQQVCAAHPAVVYTDAIEAIKTIAESGFVAEITKYDDENQLLYING